MALQKIECPVCCKQSRIYAAYCSNKHWVCIDCIERISCHLIYDTSYMYTDIFTDNNYKQHMRCPLCREGSFRLAPGTIDGALYLNLDIDTNSRVSFRGKSYKCQADAIKAWMSIAQYTIECGHCDRPSYFVRAGESVDAYLDDMRKTCTRCNDCGLILPLDEMRQHVLKIHYPLIDPRKYGPRWSRRIYNYNRNL